MKEIKKVPAPIDNKCILEDVFENNVFRDFYAAPNHREKNHTLRSLVGSVKKENYDAIVDVWWFFGENIISIRLLGYPPQEEVQDVREEVMAHYKRIFKGFQCKDNHGLVVETKRIDANILVVEFLFETDNINE